MRRKGSVTVFSALMLSVLSVFILTLSGSARRLISKSEAEFAADNAVRSCFAEYNKAVFDRFHILLLDSSYKQTESGEDRVVEHLAFYLDNSMTGNTLCSVGLTGYRSAAEDEYRYLYESAVRYEKEKATDRGISGYTEDELFLEYIADVCTNALAPSENSYRDGETEYLLYRLGPDEDNIRQALSDYEEETEDEDNSYAEFLRARLADEDKVTLVRRFAELVTEYARNNKSPGFDLDTCYHSLSFTALVESGSTGEYTVTKGYSYDPDT